MNCILAPGLARGMRAVPVRTLFASAVGLLVVLIPSSAVYASMDRPAFQGAAAPRDIGGGGGGMFSLMSLGTPGFDIILNFHDTPTAGELAAFLAAEATWESIITGYRITDIAHTEVLINVDLDAIDGPGLILGGAGPTYAKLNAAQNAVSPTFLYADEGDMIFDTADTATYLGLGLFDEIVLHEMGHVLGVGTLWNASDYGFFGRQEHYVFGSGKYTGPAGLAAYNEEFGQTGTWVPVELGGGGGTANAHWDEGNGGTLTGRLSNIEPPPFNDMRYELMTGWLNTQNVFLSTLTKRSMIDLGYTVAPEPGALVMVMAALLTLAGTRSASRRG